MSIEKIMETYPEQFKALVDKILSEPAITKVNKHALIVMAADMTPQLDADCIAYILQNIDPILRNENNEFFCLPEDLKALFDKPVPVIEQDDLDVIFDEDEESDDNEGSVMNANIPVAEKTATPPQLQKTATPPQLQKTVDPVVPKVVKTAASFFEDVFVPKKDSSFVRWGHFADVEKIVASGAFYPVFITGHSGNGKTMMVEQVCAKLNKNYMRVQISPETDEDDLIGGYRLINGETVFTDGPVIRAMRAGALLLIDEIDRGSNKIMCLQGVLEGKPVLIKKTGEVVHPAKGFNVISTANTKGQGSDDGKYIAATIIDEAFLERFTITIEQPFPPVRVERSILKKHMKKFGVSEDNYNGFIEILIRWAESIRKTYKDGGVSEVISTRRLCHIAQTFGIFNNRQKAVLLCISRFDEDTKQAFLQLYSSLDAKAHEFEEELAKEDEDAKNKKVPF